MNVQHLTLMILNLNSNLLLFQKLQIKNILCLLNKVEIVFFLCMRCLICLQILNFCFLNKHCYYLVKRFVHFRQKILEKFLILNLELSHSSFLFFDFNFKIFFYFLLFIFFINYYNVIFLIFFFYLYGISKINERV